MDEPEVAVGAGDVVEWCRSEIGRLNIELAIRDVRIKQLDAEVSALRAGALSDVVLEGKVESDRSNGVSKTPLSN